MDYSYVIDRSSIASVIILIIDIPQERAEAETTHCSGRSHRVKIYLSSGTYTFKYKSCFNCKFYPLLIMRFLIINVTIFQLPNATSVMMPDNPCLEFVPLSSMEKIVIRLCGMSMEQTIILKSVTCVSVLLTILTCVHACKDEHQTSNNSNSTRSKP